MATERILRLVAGLVLLFCVCSSRDSFSQAQFTLTGTVTDESGAALPGATVTLITESGMALSTRTDDLGRFVFAAAPLDAKTIRVDFPLFAPVTKPVLQPASGSTVSINIVLNVDMVEITVTGSRTNKLDRRIEVNPAWNVWIEEWNVMPAFQALEALKPDRDYLLALDLSAFPYLEKGVDFKGASSDLTRLLRESDRDSEVVQAVLLIDPTYFDPVQDYIKEVPIDMRKVNEALDSGVTLPVSPFATLQSEPDADFRFGWQTFRIHTGREEGPASIAISFWADHRRPIGEITLSTCISADGKFSRKCRDRKTVRHGFRGADSIKIATNPGDHLPDAALHLLELDPQTIMGVFRCNRCPGWQEDELRYWNLHMSAETFKKLSRAFLDEVGAAPAADDLVLYGKGLYGTLFSRCRPKETQCEEARAAFQTFISANLRKKGDDRSPATLFVRVVDRAGTPFSLLPIGLMSVPITPEGELVGYHVRVETPLAFQDYAVEEDCISRWMILVPPENDSDLAAARARLQKTIGNWPEEMKLTETKAFREWIGVSDDDDEPSVLMTFSHHDGKSLFFKSQPKFLPGFISRQFRTPSVAILNGCGNFKPDHTELVNTLNWHGITTVIATSTDVDSLMAADFFGILAAQLTENASNPNHRIADAYFKAIRTLWDTRTEQGAETTWGPRALIYSLVGNGALRLCTPQGQ